MKKQIIVASILAFLHLGVNAQMRITNVTSTTYPASTTVESQDPGSSTNLIIGDNGSTATPTGVSNTFIGQEVGANNTGSSNTFVGRTSGLSNQAGSWNTFIGRQSGQNTYDGEGNTFIGGGSGFSNIGGDYNIAIGIGAGSTSAYPYLTNSTAIGFLSQVENSNTLSLGAKGSTSYAVKVGIGSSDPDADLHIYKESASGNSGTSILSHWADTDNQSSLDLRTGSTTFNDLILSIYGNTSTYPLLPNVYSSSSIDSRNMGLIATKVSPLMIGIEPSNTAGNTHDIHFVNNIKRSSSSGTLTPWECVRINNNNGFVGIHTRTAPTSASSGGTAQAIFHVNLLNPALLDDFSTLTQGIRFEGLPSATTHTNLLMADGDGNLAIKNIGTWSPGLEWKVTGNSASTSDFIGTTNNEDFRFQTNSTPRGKITKDGNLDFGSNDFSSGSATKSGAFGDLNKFTNAGNSFATGESNNIDVSQSSGCFGSNNSIENGDYNFAIGKDNIISTTLTYAIGKNVIIGVRDTIIQSEESVLAGEENYLESSHGSFIGGSHNKSLSGNYAMILGLGNTIYSGENNSIVGNNNELLNPSGNSHLCGNSSTVKGNSNFSLGNDLNIEGNNNFAFGNLSESIGSGNFAFGNDAHSISAIIDNVNKNIFTFGERVTNRRDNSMVFGFDNNRTAIITKRGVAVQLQDPGFPTITYDPTVNFEVQAGVFPGPTSPLPISIVRSNVRFHNLPPTSELYPPVVIDPSTGELFLYDPNAQGPSAPPQAALTDTLNQIKESYALLQQALKAQQRQIDELLAAVRTLTEAKQTESLAKIDIQLSNNDAIILNQNIPNPCDRYTSVGFNIPQNVQNAVINFSTMDGKMIKSVSIKERGRGMINIQTAELNSGIYIYSLIADGRLIDSKKMEINR